MSWQKWISLIEFIIALVTGVLTAVFSILIYIQYQSALSGRFTKFGITQLLYFVANSRTTFLLSFVPFIILAILFTTFYVSDFSKVNHLRDRNKRIPISIAFLAVFLVLSIFASFYPLPANFNAKVGIYAMAASFEQVTVVTSALLFVLAMVFTPLWNGGEKKSYMESFLHGKLGLSLNSYSASVVPAAIFAAILYIFTNSGIIEAVEFFIIFMIFVLFTQRYGIGSAIFLVIITIGSNVIATDFVSFTGTFYSVLIIIFAFIGLISSLTVNVSLQKKGEHSAINGKNSQQSGSVSNLGNQQEGKTDNNQQLRDSREIADQLFIRGICPNCDSVEFYVKSSYLECKKCKSNWTGTETGFQSFKVGRNKKFGF